MSFGSPSPPSAPPPPPNVPMFGADKKATKPRARSMQTTFLGGGTQGNPTNTGNATLMGAA